MIWLIWKEYRLQRLVLGVGTVLMLLPYSIFLIALWIGVPNIDWQAAPVISMYLAVLTLALLGGNAIANERADRSAEFLALQPLTRLRIMLSKLAIPLVAMLVIWGANGLAFLGVPDRQGDLVAFRVAVLAGLSAFGVGWFVSSFQSSPTFAVASGIATPLTLLAIVGPTFQYFGLGQGTVFLGSLATVSLVLALVGVIGGIWLYVRRVEP